MVHSLIRQAQFRGVKVVEGLRNALRTTAIKNVVTRHTDDLFYAEEILAHCARQGKRAKFIFVVQDPRRQLLIRSSEFPAHRVSDVDHSLLAAGGHVSLTGPGVVTHGNVISALMSRDDVETLLIRREDLIADPVKEVGRIARFTSFTPNRLCDIEERKNLSDENIGPWHSSIGPENERLVRQTQYAPELVNLVIRFGYADDATWLNDLIAATNPPIVDHGAICAFHTGDTLYSAEAERMLASAQRLDLRVELAIVADDGSWLENVRKKPRILQRMALRMTGPMLYVDVDAIFHADPWKRLSLVETDVAFATYRDGRARSGTVYVADTRGGQRFLTAWAKRLAASPAAWDQHPLDDILQEYRDGRSPFTISLLPISLCQVFDRIGATSPPTPSIIEHLQASRERKEDSPKILLARERRQGRLAELSKQ
jgi:hypothetical protein